MSANGFDPALAREATAVLPTCPARAVAGSVEECLAYCSKAVGCWMDFIENGVDDWVASRLARAGEIAWPPRSCIGETSKFLAKFVQTTDAADVEAAASAAEDSTKAAAASDGSRGAGDGDGEGSNGQEETPVPMPSPM